MKLSSLRHISSSWRKKVTRLPRWAMAQMPSNCAGSKPSTSSSSMKWCLDWAAWKPCSKSRTPSPLLPLWCVPRAKRRTSWTRLSGRKSPTISSSPSTRTKSCSRWKRTSTKRISWPRWRRADTSRTTSRLLWRWWTAVPATTGWRYTEDSWNGNWNWAIPTARWPRCSPCRRRRLTSDSPNSSPGTIWNG